MGAKRPIRLVIDKCIKGEFGEEDVNGQWVSFFTVNALLIFYMIVFNFSTTLKVLHVS